MEKTDVDFERFPLGNHIVHLDTGIKAPEYIESQPFLDLTSLERLGQETHDPNNTRITKAPSAFNINVVDNFPDDLDCGMDASQMSALKTMVTKRVAIIQGPPGTGKTFVSVSGLQVMIQNMRPDDPPIIIAAQTNHALDQLMNHVMSFEPEVVRLGNRSDKENVTILKRTLYELRMSNQDVPHGKVGLRRCYKEHQDSCQKIKSTLAFRRNIASSS